ncbi:hypothetical protein KJ885_00810 [Patescibacteria group bacterium]|nr:hypothetical protein [Patescibacteria group bacterium]
MFDAYEAHPQILARYSGGKDLKIAIQESFDSGKCQLILEKLAKGKISIKEAVSDINSEIDCLHQKIHNT